MSNNDRFHGNACRRGHNNFLDDVLDGKPFHMVTTPGFRRDLRRRAIERRLEDEAYERDLRRRMGLVL